MPEQERTPRELHTQAMMYFQDAIVERHQHGKTREYNKLIEQALELEREAARLIPARLESEPTYSILWRSVASLALTNGQDYSAFKAAEKGLEIAPRPSDEKMLRAIIDGSLTSRTLDKWMKENT